MIITTDTYFKGTSDDLKKEIALYWSKITAQLMPPVQLMVVPRKFEDKFHGRAIITSDTGVDLGQSLNGLGKSRDKLTVLPEEDAKDLEKTYVDEMLHQMNWFMEQGVAPMILNLGGR